MVNGMCCPADAGAMNLKADQPGFREDQIELEVTLPADHELAPGVRSELSLPFSFEALPIEASFDIDLQNLQAPVGGVSRAVLTLGNTSTLDLVVEVLVDGDSDPDTGNQHFFRLEDSSWWQDGLVVPAGGTRQLGVLFEPTAEVAGQEVDIVVRLRSRVLGPVDPRIESPTELKRIPLVGQTGIR